MKPSVTIVLFGIALAVAGCGGSGSAPAPTAPSQLLPQPTSPLPNDDAFIKGVVYDTANRTLAGAVVKVLDGPLAGLSVTTDAKGEFSMTGTFDDSTRFRATEESHISATRILPPICPQCHPHRWLYFFLDVSTPPANIAGDYTLTFIADSACTALPDESRTRTYEGTMTPAPGSNTAFTLELSGASLLTRSFWTGVSGDYLSIWFGDPSLAERLAPTTYLELGGEATATVGTSGVSTISASFNGEFDYCARTSAMGSYYDCAPGPAVIAHARCASTHHQLILTRR